jgi:hypothetical protein
VCHNACLSIFTSLDQETGFGIIGGAGGALRGGGSVRETALYVSQRNAKYCQQSSNYDRNTTEIWRTVRPLSACVASALRKRRIHVI